MDLNRANGVVALKELLCSFFRASHDTCRLYAAAEIAQRARYPHSSKIQFSKNVISNNHGDQTNHAFVSSQKAANRPASSHRAVV